MRNESFKFMIGLIASLLISVSSFAGEVQKTDDAFKLVDQARMENAELVARVNIAGRGAADLMLMNPKTGKYEVISWKFPVKVFHIFKNATNAKVAEHDLIYVKFFTSVQDDLPAPKTEMTMYLTLSSEAEKSWTLPMSAKRSDEWKKGVTHTGK